MTPRWPGRGRGRHDGCRQAVGPPSSRTVGRCVTASPKGFQWHLSGFTTSASSSPTAVWLRSCRRACGRPSTAGGRRQARSRPGLPMRWFVQGRLPHRPGRILARLRWNPGNSRRSSLAVSTPQPSEITGLERQRRHYPSARILKPWPSGCERGYWFARTCVGSGRKSLSRIIHRSSSRRRDCSIDLISSCPARFSSS